jgi:hypothetical protein
VENLFNFGFGFILQILKLNRPKIHEF